MQPFGPKYHKHSEDTRDASSKNVSKVKNEDFIGDQEIDGEESIVREEFRRGKIKSKDRKIKREDRKIKTEDKRQDYETRFEDGEIERASWEIESDIES